MAIGATNKLPLLFQPLTIRGVTFKNRCVVAPMIHYRADAGNTCGAFHLVHLGKFALGGFGAVFTETTAVEPRGLNTDLDLAIFNDAQAESFRPLTSFLKAEGVVPAIQLGHAGRKACIQTAAEGMGPLTDAQIKDGRRVWQPVAPSPIAVGPEWMTPHELTTAEVEDVVDAFAAGARRAVEAGFEVVEIHGAHGYLITSFLSPVTNKRGDKYGGDLAGRMRMALEVAEACRAAIPDRTPLFFRASCVDGTVEGWQLEDTVVLARELKARGVDVIDCSSGGLLGAATAARVTRSLGFQVPFSERVRREADIPTMAVGIILEGQQAEAILQEGKADLIAVGRQAQYNANVALHWAHELGINKRFELWHPEYGWWLEKRIRTLEGFATPEGVVTKRD